MAASYIPVDRSKELGSALLNAASQARSFGNAVAALRSVMDGMSNGTDYSILEERFGLPAGRGADVSYLITALKSGLDGVAQFHLFSDWFGQV